ncbi:serine/threonine protein kinase [Acidobacteria bacterium AH-259-D05]|nr:serine/threonine protein kinase [Acidobacteria bacterium AH-259-D05]
MRVLIAGEREQPKKICSSTRKACADFVRDTNRDVSSETKCLLCGRLKAAGLVITIGTALYLVRALLIGDTALLAFHFFVLVVLAALTGYLFTSGPRSLEKACWIGILIFGLPALLLAGKYYTSLLAAAQAENEVKMMLVMTAIVFCLFVLMVVYGLFIPNNWGQASLLVIPLAMIPIPVNILLRYRHPEVEQLIQKVATFEHISMLVVMLLIGALVAIYGAHTTHSARTELFEAKQLGHYRLTEKIGTGGMGEVWRAEHDLLARPAAVKLIRPEVLGENNGGSAVALRRFEREARATAILHSPHTIDIYDFGTTPNKTFYYVMELLEGLDLETLIDRFGPVSPGRAIYLLKQVCKSLAEAHHTGLIHRDVKPANVYTTRQGLEYDFIKVLDFGLVKGGGANSGDTRLTMAGTTTGTPAYMAPELAVGKENVDARADIYSLGCVAYWLLTGQLVFENSNPVAMVVDHVNKPPSPPSQRTEIEIPDALERVILSCLEKEPDARPSSALDLYDRLEACNLDSAWNQQHAKDWWQLHGIGLNE